MSQLSPQLLIRASAGTGKTYQLALRFIALLVAGARPEEILASTFTRKAAGEILDRVLGWLAEAALEESRRRELAEALRRPDLDQAACGRLLRTLLERLHRLRVGTLDSFFLQVAIALGPELGLLPGWSIGEEEADQALRDEAIHQLLTEGHPQDLATMVHALTKGAARRSVARLVQETIQELFELYRETPTEVWERLPKPRRPTASQVDQAFEQLRALAGDDNRLARAIRDDLCRFLDPDPEAFVEAGLAAKVLSGENAYYGQPLPEKLIRLYDTLLAEARARLLEELAWQTQGTHDLLERFAQRYQALQRRRGLLRFSDVTACVASVPDRLTQGLLAFRLEGAIRHILLDEFQDTSPLQWRALRPLVHAVRNDPRGSFFCVGDRKQAIYGWRGGVADLLDALPDELPGLAERTLSESYRSSPPVIEAVNTVFRNLTRHPDLDDLAEAVGQWQAAFPPHTTARHDLRGLVRLVVGPAPEEGQDVEDAVLLDAVRRVQTWQARAAFASIGILVRENQTVARQIYHLRKCGILASEEGGNPLVDSPAVELILSLLMLADHPGDRVARFHLAHSPLAGPLSQWLAGTTAEGPPDPFHEDDDRAAARASRALRRQLLQEGYGRTMLFWARRLAEACDARQRFRLEQLVEQAYAYQPQSTLRPGDFVRLIQQRRVADPTAAPVRVMTIHQAKGLQFDVVILPELGVKLVGQPPLVVAGRPAPAEPIDRLCRRVDKATRRLLPPTLQRLFEEQRAREASEALCLLYVAMTRAVHVLEMILPPPAPNEQRMPKTFAGLLRVTLAPDRPAEPAAVLYEGGDPHWYLSVPGARSAPVETRQAQEPPQEPSACGPDGRPRVLLAPPALDLRRGLMRVSPSGMEGGRVLRGAALVAPRREAVLDEGTLLHRWLAEVEWLEDGLPGEAQLLDLARQQRDVKTDLSSVWSSLLQRLRQMVNQPAVAELLSRRFYQTPAGLALPGLTAAWTSSDPPQPEVHSEWPFAVRRGETLVQGAVDRLVVLRRGEQILAADVIDFKTDELPSDRHREAVLAERTAFYRPQLETYREAAGQVLGLPVERVAARLVFLQAGRVVLLRRTTGRAD